MKKSNWLGVIDNRLQIDAEIEEYISSNLSNGKVAITNANGKLRSSAVGIAELALISGVSSNVQEQLDALPSTYHPLISTGSLAQTKVDNLTNDLASKQNKSTAATDSTMGVVRVGSGLSIQSDSAHADYGSMSVNFSGYALSNDIPSDYVSTGSLETTLGDYALDSDIPSDYLTSNDIVWAGVASSTAVYHQNSVMIGATNAPSSKLEVKTSRASHTTEDTTTAFRATLTDTGVGETGIVAGQQSSTNVKTPFEVLANGSPVFSVSYDGTVTVNGTNHGSAVFKSTTAAVTQYSGDLVTSGAVYTAISNVTPSTTSSVSENIGALVTSGAVYSALESYVLDSDLVANYVSTTSLSTTLESYALDSDLPEYDVMGADNTYAAGLVTAGGATHNDTFLRKDGTWQTPTDTEYDVMGADNTYAAGLVTAGGATHNDTFLRKDGTWQTPTDTDYSAFDSSTAGLVPASGGESTALFLSQAGTFITVPPPAGPNLSAYVTTTALETTLGDYVLDSDLPNYSAFDSSTAGLVPASGGESTGKFLSQAGTFILVPPPAGPNLSAYVTTTALETTLGDYVLDSDLPNYSAFDSSTAGLVPASGGESTALFLSQAGTFITVPPPAGPNLSAYVTTTALETTLGDYVLDSDLPNYSAFDSSTAGLVPASGGESTGKFLSQAGTFITVPPPAAPNLSAYVTTTALETTLGDYVLDSNLPSYSAFDSSTAGLVPASGGESTGKFLSQAGTFITVPPPAAPNLSAYVTTTALETTLGDYALDSDLPSTTDTVTSGSDALVTSGAVHTKLADYALDSDLPSTTDTVTSGSDALVTSGAVHTKLADYALDSDLPGIVYSVSDGSTLPVSSGAVFTALADNTVEPRIDLVGEFTLQTSENLRSSPTFLRWTPALVNVHGLTHNATNNIPQGTLFTCVVDRATYHINIMLVSSNAITNNRTYLSCTIRYYRKAPSTTGRGELDRTYFIGEGYCRAYNGTNQVWFGGDITLHMRELEQFEIVSVVRYATSSKAVPADASETLMRIERVVY